MKTWNDFIMALTVILLIEKRNMETKKKVVLFLLLRM